MKRISLRNLNLNAVEQLSKAQLKDVFGGISSPATVPCNCDNGNSGSVSCNTAIECAQNCWDFCS